MTTRTYKRLSLAVAVLLALRCRPVAAEHAHAAAETTPAGTSALTRHVAQAAPPGAVNCGIGRDARSDAAVYNCGSDAFAHRRPFYAVFLPWPGPASDIITSPTQLSAAYVADDTHTIAAVTQIGPSDFRTTPLCGDRVGSAAPIRPLRGMRLPQFSSTGPMPRQPHHTAIIELVVTADSRVADARVVKPTSSGTDHQALALLTRSLSRPAHLFGVAVPVLVTVAVDDENGTLTIREPSDR